MEQRCKNVHERALDLLPKLEEILPPGVYLEVLSTDRGEGTGSVRFIISSWPPSIRMNNEERVRHLRNAQLNGTSLSCNLPYLSKIALELSDKMQIIVDQAFPPVERNGQTEWDTSAFVEIDQKALSRERNEIIQAMKRGE